MPLTPAMSQPVFFIDASQPETRQIVLKRLRVADALKRRSQNSHSTTITGHFSPVIAEEIERNAHWCYGDNVNMCCMEIRYEQTDHYPG
jgi:hypothetical protein